MSFNLLAALEPQDSLATVCVKVSRKRERGREKRDRARAGEIRGGDRGLVGHARVVGRHAARRAEWEKGDGTSVVRDRKNSRNLGFRAL